MKQTILAISLIALLAMTIVLAGCTTDYNPRPSNYECLEHHMKNITIVSTGAGTVVGNQGSSAWHIYSTEPYAYELHYIPLGDNKNSEAIYDFAKNHVGGQVTITYVIYCRNEIEIREILSMKSICDNCCSCNSCGCNPCTPPTTPVPCGCTR